MIGVYKYNQGELTPLQEPIYETQEWVRKALIYLRGEMQDSWPDLREVTPEVVNYVIDNYLLVWTGSFLCALDVIDNWFIQSKILSEEFIVPFGRHTPGKAVDEMLVAVAKRAGCTRITRGTRSFNTRQDALVRLLKGQGYHVSTVELTKEIPNE